MAKIPIGNIKGPEGPVGPAGKGDKGEPGKRGSYWYEGVAITGEVTEPTIYETGLTDAQEQDYYLNVRNGNMYRCITGGDESTATWSYVGNLKNNQGSIDDTLNSTSKTRALSADAGRRLNEKIDNAGLYAKRLNIDCTSVIYAVKLRVENADTTIYVTDEHGNIGTYSYMATGESGEKEITVWISSAIGLKNGVVVKSIESTNTSIREYTLYDSENNAVQNVIPSIWDNIFELESDIKEEITITEETLTEEGEKEQTAYKAYSLTQRENGERVTAFLITHAKAVWWNKSENKTLYDKIREDFMRSEQIMRDVNAMAELPEEDEGKYIPDARAIAMKIMEVEGMIPIIRFGTEEPDDSVGKDYDIYIKLKN